MIEKLLLTPVPLMSEPSAPAPLTPEAASVLGLSVTPPAPVEHGGRAGPEPTRYGDWEKNGRCIDF